MLVTTAEGLPQGLSGKESLCNAGDLGSIPRSGRSPGEVNCIPLQYSCLENSMDGGAWWAKVHGVAELDTTQQPTHTHTTAEGVGAVGRTLTLHSFKLWHL